MSDDRIIPTIYPTDRIAQNQPTENYASSVASSELSTTSTEIFEHEPFSTLQARTIELCKTIWPSLAIEAFQVIRMEGGSFNRVAKIRVDTSKKHSTWIQRQVQCWLGRVSFKTQHSGIKEYLIRMPRYQHAWVEHEIFILKYLSDTMVPTPEVIFFNFSSDNLIGNPFSIQHFLPGKPVQEVYLELNSAQRISFASSLGNAIAEMRRLRSPCPGTLDPDTILGGSSGFGVLQLQCPPRSALRTPSGELFTQSVPQSVYDFIITQCARQREYDLSLHREHTNPWKCFIPIVEELNKEGFFNDDMFYLTHMDFEPRNLLLDITSPTTATLSAIIDWDEAVFAPAFANCRPPSWLWDFEGDGDLDEEVAHQTPDDPDLQAIKGAFEEAVGSDFLKYAYSSEYRIARNICKLAITGFHSNDEYEVALGVIKQWNELKPHCRVGGLFEGEDNEDDE